MDTHIKIVGWLWIIVGALGLLGALCAIVSIAGGGLISGDQDALIRHRPGHLHLVGTAEQRNPSAL